MDEVPLLELMPEHCLRIAALIFYCALDCLIKKSVRIRKSSMSLVRVSLLCCRKARKSAFRGRHVTAKHLNYVIFGLFSFVFFNIQHQFISH